MRAAALGGEAGWRRDRRRISGKRLRSIERLKSEGLSNRASEKALRKPDRHWDLIILDLRLPGPDCVRPTDLQQRVLGPPDSPSSNASSNFAGAGSRTSEPDQGTRFEFNLPIVQQVA